MAIFTMADFSKQYTEINNSEIPGDFDIIDEFNKLEDDHYISMICEGFGFIAIGKQKDVPKPKLLFRFEQAIKQKHWNEPIPVGLKEDDCVWIDYDKLFNKLK